MRKSILNRYAPRLAATNFGSKQQADTQQALVAQLTAQIQGDQAAIDNAKAILDYATIRAPIDGRTGIRAVDVGNILRMPSDANGIAVTITQVKPISVVFNLAQQQLPALNAAMARGRTPARSASPPTMATLIDEGAVEVIDNLVDQTTGTIKVKAVFPNDKQQLLAGRLHQHAALRRYAEGRHRRADGRRAARARAFGPFVYVLAATIRR